MLLASLFLVLGSAWAQTQVLKLTSGQIGTTYPYALTDEDAAKVFELTDLTIAVKVNTPESLSGRHALFCTSDPTKDANTSAMATNSHYVAYGTSVDAKGVHSSYLASCINGDKYSDGTIPVNTEDVVLVYVLNTTTNNYKAYINGAEVMDRNFGGYEIATPKMVEEDYDNAKIYIGGGVKADKPAFETFNGTITGVEVYDGVLTAEQVANVFPTFRPEVDKEYALREVESGLYLDIQTLGIVDGYRATNNISLNQIPFVVKFEEGTSEGTWKMKNANGKYIFHNPINAGNNGHWNPEIGDNSSDWIFSKSVDGRLTIARAVDGKFVNVDTKAAGKPLYCDKATGMEFEIVEYAELKRIYVLKCGDFYLSMTASGNTAYSLQSAPSYFYMVPSSKAYFFENKDENGKYIGTDGKDNRWDAGTGFALWNVTETNEEYTISRFADADKCFGTDEEPQVGRGLYTNVSSGSVKKWKLIPVYPITIVYIEEGNEIDRVNAVIIAGESYTIDTKGKPVASCVTDEGTIQETDGVYTISAVNSATTVTVTFADKYTGSNPTITGDEISTVQSYGQYLNALTLGSTSLLSNGAQPSSASDMHVQILDASVDVVQGTEYTFTLTFPKNQTSQALVARVWMDKDGDGTYESLLSTTGVAEKYTDLTTVKFAVPYDATPGVTRIRLRLDGAWAISQTADGATKRMVYDIEVNVVEAPKTDITYNLIYKGEKIATENIRAVIGANFPVPTTAFMIDTQYLSFALPEGTVGENPVTYDVEVTVIAKGFPIPTTIANGSFAEDTQWYLATLRNARVKYNGSTEVVTTTDKVFSDAHLFALTGDPVNGFQFYNKALGTGKAIYSNNPVNLDNNNPTPVELTTTPDGTWSVTSNSHGGFSFVIENNSTNYYLHEKLTKLSFWQSSSAKTDAGSSLIFKEAYDFTFFITGVPEDEDAGATFSGNSIVNGAKVVETEYVSKDLFDANDIEGYSWSITVDKNA